MQIKLYAHISKEYILEQVKDLQLEPEAEKMIMHFNEVGLFVAFDYKTGEISGIQLDDTYPLINPIDSEMLKSIMEFRQMHKDLSVARKKSEELLTSIDEEMKLKERKGITWRRDQCADWLVMQDAMNVLGKLRAKHGV